jgi:phosphoglycolate/pyridoxal phosphate phosphatase family enzyme
MMRAEALAVPPRVFVFDMDGVIWTMDDPIPGAADAIRRLLDRRAEVYYLTNNSSKTREDYVQKLARFGIPTDTGHVMTSAYATALVLRSEGAEGKSVYVIGEAGLRRELADAGLRVLDTVDGRVVDYVVVGWDRQFTYEKLAQAHRAVCAGAEFIATNRDATYPDAGGRTLPGGGTLVMALQTCTGVEPRTIGKPEPHTLDLILRQAAAAPTECLVVGDRLDTDVAIGKRVGTRTAVVLTGVTSRADIEAAGPGDRPDFVWNDLTEMWQ